MMTKPEASIVQACEFVPVVMLSCFLIAAAAQSPIQPYVSPYTVVERSRLARTPHIDGKIGVDEWDPVTSTDYLRTYFQWEPDRLHFAATLPMGQDLVLSLDRGANGWLVGKDNLEARISLRHGKPELTVRVLEMAGPQGPVWVPVNGFAKTSKLAASTDVTMWNVEVTLVDPGLKLLPTAPGQCAIRIEGVLSDAPPADAFLPRALATVKLVTERAAGLPEGLRWGIEALARSVVPGETTRQRWTYNGSDRLGLQRLDLQMEGDAKGIAQSKGVPFPQFDRKSRAFVDYETRIPEGVTYGYRVLRGTLTSGDDLVAALQSSIRVAPLIDFDLTIERMPKADETRVQRFAVILKSNSTRRLDGLLYVTAPEGWRLLKGTGKSFIIYHSRGSVRRTFELEVPAGVEGTFPIEFKAQIGHKEVVDVAWLTVGAG